jgi:hypothetical protein
MWQLFVLDISFSHHQTSAAINIRRCNYRYILNQYKHALQGKTSSAALAS